jgi:FtsH-binding integral membrane protein
MFFAMLFANLAGIMAIGKHPAYKRNTGITLLLLLAGGMILGPLVQKYAFDAYWTGIPFGYDLTDNKTLIGVAFWVIAWLGNRGKDRPYLTILAAIMLLLVYSIPHSMFGSELNYNSGQVQTGWILLFQSGL